MTRIGRTFLVLYAAAVVTSCGEIPPIERLRGQMQAQSDVSEGKLRLLSWGLIYTTDWGVAYERLLESRYGIKSVAVGCVVSDGRLADWKAYNAVMEDAIYRKYGRDVFQRTSAEVERGQ